MRYARKKKSSLGASMVEVSLVLVVALLLMTFFFEMARYYAVRAILYRGAVEALNIATKAPFIDTAPGTISTSQAARDLFNSERRRVLNSATRFPYSSIIHAPGTGGMQRLLNFTQTEGTANVPVAAILLRPGECFTASDGYTSEHPTAPCSTSGSLTDYEAALRLHPLAVEMRTRFDFLLPIFGSTTITTRAIGYREQLIRGGNSIPGGPPVAIVASTSSSSTSSSVTTTSNTSNTSTSTTSGGSSTSTSSSSTSSTTGTSTSSTHTTSTSVPPCSRTCGENQFLVTASCTCYCNSGFCPSDVPNPAECSSGCGGG